MRKNVKPDYFFGSSIKAPEVKALIPRIQLAELPTQNSLATRVEIITTSGQKVSEYREYPKGEQNINPMSKDEILNKYRSNVAFSEAISEKNGEAILKLLEKLDGLENINKIVRLMTV